MIKSLEACEEVTSLSEEIADLSPTSPGISRRQSAKSQTRPWQDRYKFARKSTSRQGFLMCTFYTKCALLICAGVNSQTPHFRTYSRRALFDLPKLCIMVELVVLILKGVNHFSIQFIVFPLGGKMLIFGH